MRLFITVMLLLAATFSFAQNEKKAQEAVKKYLRDDKKLTDYQEIVFGPLEELTRDVDLEEDKELKDLEFKLALDSIFAQIAVEMGDTSKYAADPAIVKRVEELRKRKNEPSRKEKGYKMLHMCKVRQGREEWKTMVVVVFFDKNQDVLRANELEY